MYDEGLKISLAPHFLHYFLKSEQKMSQHLAITNTFSTFAA